MTQNKGMTQEKTVIEQLDSTKMTTRILVFDYIRTFAVILVLLYHTVLAYTTTAEINPDNPTKTYNPVADSQRWYGFDLIALFTDTFFMPLLFFISGLFIWQSLTRKGTWKFIRDRLIRLGIPLITGVLILMPLAYYPAQLQIELIYGVSLSYIEFWFGLLKTGFGATGPLWFLEVLLVFNVLIVIMHKIAPHLDSALKLRASTFFKHPLAFFGLLIGVSTAAYIPAFIFGLYFWITFGPFTFEASRILFYLVYFLAGTAVGVYGVNSTIFKSKSKLARHWWLWLIAGLVSLILFRNLVIPCATIIFGVVATFLRFTKHRISVIDSLSNSSFGIYIIHFVFVLWLQYLLLSVNIHVIYKAFLVFTGALTLSWMLIAAIRQIPTVAKVI